MDVQEAIEREFWQESSDAPFGIRLFVKHVQLVPDEDVQPDVVVPEED